MKIRTDFVTNSSSSSFVVELELETMDGARYVFETKPTEEGANSDLKCTGADIAGTDSVENLCELLQKSMTGTGKAKIKSFSGEIKENVDDFGEISSVTLRRIWISMGESSGWTVANDARLQELAQKLTSAKGAEKEAACDEFLSYLKKAEVHAEGGWQDMWPTGFAGNSAVPRYKWDHLGVTAEALAKKITANKINNNDLAVETVVVDMQNKTVTESADFIVDSTEKGIGKKPACRSNKFFTNIITTAFAEYEVRQSVAAAELMPDCGAEIASLDYVICKDGEVKAAISVKSAESAKSKAFKAIAPACAAASVEYVILDEKKDSTEAKIISKINEALFADVFASYVVGMKTEGVSENAAASSGEGRTVKVKFADNRSYEYNCFDEIRVGDVVCVGGSKAGQRGMVVAVTGDKTVPAYYSVDKILRY